MFWPKKTRKQVKKTIWKPDVDNAEHDQENPPEIPPNSEVKLSDLFVFPNSRKRSTELGHSTFQSRQTAQAKSAKMLLLQELNFEEVPKKNFPGFQHI